MSTKIEGILTDAAVRRLCNSEMTYINLTLFRERRTPQETDHRTVLIVSSDGQPPRYFTQEEVKAMDMESLRLLEKHKADILSYLSQKVTSVDTARIVTFNMRDIDKHIASLKAKHGITDL